MKTIGIRELRQNASRYLRDVQSGETIEVTDRGEPVARLSPISKRHGIAALEEAGRLTAARGSLADLGPPVGANPDIEPASQTLERLRSDER